jgi:hypothetical protein
MVSFSAIFKPSPEPTQRQPNDYRHPQDDQRCHGHDHQDEYELDGVIKHFVRPDLDHSHFGASRGLRSPVFGSL